MEHTRRFRITIPLTLDSASARRCTAPFFNYDVAGVEIEGTLQSTKWSNCLFVP